MDPITNVKKQQELAERIQKRGEELARLRDLAAEDGFAYGELSQAQMDDGEELADLVIALNEWIGKGGFSPYNPKKEG